MICEDKITFMFLRKFKFRLIILTAFLLTFSSGLLFYQKLFINELKTTESSKSDIDELRFLDISMNLALMELKNNFQSNADELHSLQNRSRELIDLIFELRKEKESDELKTSQNNIKNYFETKFKNISSFETVSYSLKKNILDLNSSYLEIQRAKLKYTLDGKDFYRECLGDTLLYLLAPTKDVVWKFNEDIKILAQLSSYTKTPLPAVDNYLKKIESIRKDALEIDSILKNIKNKSIGADLSIVLRYDNEIKERKDSRGQSFLYLVFISIALYALVVIFVFRKL